MRSVVTDDGPDIDAISSATPGSPESTVQRLRDLIISGELLPGQQLRQAQLAERLQVSRIPIREALATLLAERTVVHTPNAGYTVARFTIDDLRQIYLMRALLETALLERVDRFPTTAIKVMEAKQAAMLAAAEAGAVIDWMRENREFHFVGFRLASMDFVLAEVEQLWNVSDFYRSLYFYDSGAMARTTAEHEPMIEYARRGDRDALIRSLTEHRDKGVEKLDTLFVAARHPMIAK